MMRSLPIRAGTGNLDTGISGFLAGHNRRMEVHEEASPYTANAGNAHIYGGEFAASGPLVYRHPLTDQFALTARA